MEMLPSDRFSRGIIVIDLSIHFSEERPLVTMTFPRTERRNARGIVVQFENAAPHLLEVPPPLTNARESDFIRLAPRLDSR